MAYLTEGEFGRWVEADRDWKESVVTKLDTLTADKAIQSTEIALLKVAHTKAAQRSGTISAGISAIVTGITMGIVSAFK